MDIVGGTSHVFGDVGLVLHEPNVPREKVAPCGGIDDAMAFWEDLLNEGSEVETGKCGGWCIGRG